MTLERRKRIMKVIRDRVADECLDDYQTPLRYIIRCAIIYDYMFYEDSTELPKTQQGEP